jgi:hypothetical protein
MREQSLTVVQLKKIYFNPAVPCLEVIQDGLHPDDAFEYGFLPVLSVMLSSPGPGIYYQQLYPINQPICLVSFLADAWQNLRLFFSVPDRLIVYPELLETYPLSSALRAIDPSGSIKIVGTRNHFIGSNLRVSQDHATKIAHATKSKKKIITVDALFESANDYLKPHFHLNWGNASHRSAGFDSWPGSRNVPYPLRRLDATTVVFPRPFNTPGAISWLTKAAIKVQRIKQGQDLFCVSGINDHWVQRLVVEYSNGKQEINVIYGIGDAFKFNNDPGDRYYLDDMITPGCIWASEASNLSGGLEAIPYDVQGDIDEVISPHEFKEFLENKRPMIFTLYIDILKRILDKPCIFVAKTTKSIKDLVGMLDFVSGIYLSLELTGDNSDSIPYRLFAINSENFYPYLLAIPKGSKADTKRINKQLDGEYEGVLEIGLAGLSGLVHFVEETVELSSSVVGVVGAQMMNSMLDRFPIWGEQ